jgi:polygalacturonase
MMANVTDVRFLGVRIQFAPDWTLHFSSCTKVHVDGCWVHNGDNPNGASTPQHTCLCVVLMHAMRAESRIFPVVLTGDGIDIDSTQDFIIENSYINCEDDSLCVKSGLDALGRAYARPSRDGVFRNNHLGRGGGLTIGSEGSGGVFNITCALLSWSTRDNASVCRRRCVAALAILWLANATRTPTKC